MKENMLLVMSVAMDNAREGITICDASLPDIPIIYINNGFLKMTGYSREEVIGKNCRFLQGSKTDRKAVTHIRKAIQNHVPVQVEFTNYRKDGTPFCNKLSITPIFNKNNKLTYFIGVQDDVTIQNKNDLIHRENIKQQLIHEITLQVQEKDRKELGSELHDNINQLLATSKLYLKIASKKEEQRLDMIRESHCLIDKAIEEIRKLSRKLVVPAQSISLNDMLSELVEDLRIASPFAINFECCKLKEEQLSYEKKIMLFRVVQEQMNNIIKHAKACNVWLHIILKRSYIELQLKDDGVGFKTSKSYEGIGLKNIKSRVEFEKGTMKLQSAPGKGTELTISLPV